MAKVLVLYYFSYGRFEKLAHEIAAGPRDAGASANVKRVPELLCGGRQSSQLQARSDRPSRAHRRPRRVRRDRRRGHRHAPRQDVVPNGNLPRPGGGLWAKGAFQGKAGGAFASSATQHGGQETALFTIITNLLHFGMTVVGLNYRLAGQMKVDKITGGAPYGMRTIAGRDAQRQPSENELAGARYQGRAIAQTSAKLHG